MSIEKSPARSGLSHNQETIVALGTAPGAGAVAIIRLSGPEVLRIAALSLVSVTGKAVTFTGSQERRMKLCQFLSNIRRETVDELMAVYFKGPQSFTGEDSLELHCHGGSYIVAQILENLKLYGARQAEPGEFTRRAFLNGKMDLTKAEGIKELVEAQSHQQWMAARHLATGRLAETIEALRWQLVGAMAYLEARIDFPDEGDTQSVEMLDVRQRVEKVQVIAKKLVDSYSSGRVARDGLMVAIIGAPNMGKSTLMNTLLRRERAIVTEIAGTTRDYLEEGCLIRGRYIRLVDTAGIRKTDEVVEQIGVNKAQKLAQDADLVIFLLAADSTEVQCAEIASLMAELSHKKSLTILSKSDLGVPPWAESYLPLSCRTGDGLEKLEDAIVQYVDGYMGKIEDSPFITSARHLSHVQAALEALERFFQAMDEGLYEECLAFELQDAARALKAIIGNVDSEDILDKIFSEFCVGK